jgi:hypothetical protein
LFFRSHVRSPFFPLLLGLNLRFYIFISMQFVYRSGTHRCWIDPLVDFTAQVSISDLCVKL